MTRAKIEKIVFYLILLLLPTQLGLHFWPKWAFLYGIKIDYFSPTIYLTDILVFILFVINVRKIKIDPVKALPIFSFILLNVIFSTQIWVSLLKWVKVSEVLFLFLYVRKVKISTAKISKIIFTSALFVSVVGILQFILGKTIGGPLYLLGERTFTKFTPGISLNYFFGKTFLRPYSTFSHPNSFAGFLGISILLYFLFLKKDKFAHMFAVIPLTAFALTNSLGSAIGLFIALVSSRVGSKYHRLIITAFLIASILLAIIPNEISNIQEVYLRLVLAKEALLLFVSHPLFGTGLGTFITAGVSVSYPLTKVWFLQPVHNVFLLMLSEVGLLGTLMLYENLLTLKRIKIFSLLVFILATGLFDHYWLTLQQNMLLAGIILGLII